MAKIKWLLFFLLAGFLSCEQTDMERYNSLVKKEKSSNKKVNDIFFGISLGMTSKDFYLHCWNMNKKGVFTDGANNTSVAYRLDKKELKHPAEMNFYPKFYEGKIYNLWTRFHYLGWMPWNKHMDSDDLLEDVLKLYKKWYPAGNPFITINDEKRGTLYVKVDGNRQIVIGRYDEVEVKAEYTDLLVNAKGK